MKFIILSVALLFSVFTPAQLVVNSTVTPTNLVQNYLVGAGVVVSNVTFNGMPGNFADSQIGFFNGVNTNLAIDSGIVMSTGMVVDAVGPNNTGGVTTNFFNTSADPDLNAISSVSINDAAILEFDLVPAGDTIKFSYAFASEEYLEFANGSFNDAFGIFLSGTGISGPYANGAENIALVPGTTIPISINNVNDINNPAYYIDNGTGFSAPYNGSNTYVQYDGRTVTLTATYVVQCGGTYHLKFAIGDGGDGTYDSGVFIEAGSLTSSGIQVSLETPVGFFSNAPGLVYEDCALGSDVDFIFTRPDSTSSDTVFFDIGGNAINGTDYTTIPNNYVVFNNSDTVILTISAIGDGITEGVDTLWIAVPIASSGPCALTVSIQHICTFQILMKLIPYAGPDSVYIIVRAKFWTLPVVCLWV